MAAWLAYNRSPGETFTMRDLRFALGEPEAPNAAEHLNRRLRTLRIRDGWVIPSARDDASLAIDAYRVETVGWHPGTGTPRPEPDVPSDRVRREVFERDHGVCQVCGAVAGEPYPDNPEKITRLTLGHRIPGVRLSRKATMNDLRTECARCNEPARDFSFNPVTLPELEPRIRALGKKEKTQLLSWLEHEHRVQTRTEIYYAEAKRLSESERAALMAILRSSVGAEARTHQGKGF
jgi:5-methylcytosine-specific restriction endonuclease McrA